MRQLDDLKARILAERCASCAQHPHLVFDAAACVILLALSLLSLSCLHFIKGAVGDFAVLFAVLVAGLCCLGRINL